MRNSEPKWSNTIFFLMIPREFPFLPLHMRYILPYKAMIIKAVSYWHNAKTKTCLHSTFILNLKCDFTAEIIFCRIDENKSKLGRRENWHHWSNVARLSKYILQFVEINMHDSLVVLFIGLTDVRLFKWIVLWLKDSSRRHLSICHLLFNAEKCKESDFETRLFDPLNKRCYEKLLGNH